MLRIVSSKMHDWREYSRLTSLDNSPLEWKTTSEWEQKLKDIISSLEDGHPRFRHYVWKKIFEEQTATTPVQTLVDTVNGNLPAFSLPLGTEDIFWTVYLTEEAIWSRFHTHSQIAVLEGEQLEGVKKQVFDALKEEGVERNAAGQVALHGRTHLVWTSRI
jgi:hypothetical protein